MTVRFSNQLVAEWRNAVMVMFALGGIAVSTLGPRLPSIRDSLHLGVGVVGLVLGGVTVGSIVGLFASSSLLSVFGPRRAIGWAGAGRGRCAGS
jgi:MFS family permease